MKNNKKGSIPVGFSMSLAQNKFALDKYSQLDEEDKEKINSYIASSSTGNEAKERINSIISKLENDGTLL